VSSINWMMRGDVRAKLATNYSFRQPITDWAQTGVSTHANP
jgi:hypothetical protein